MSQPRVTIIGAGRMGSGTGTGPEAPGIQGNFGKPQPARGDPSLGAAPGKSGRSHRWRGARPDCDARRRHSPGGRGAGIGTGGQSGTRSCSTFPVCSTRPRSHRWRIPEPGCGSFHPVQSVAEPATAAERLKGAYVGIEGDERAVVAAERLANTLRMIPVTNLSRKQAGLSCRRRLRRELYRRPGGRRRATRPFGRCASGNRGSPVSASARWGGRQSDLARPRCVADRGSSARRRADHSIAPGSVGAGGSGALSHGGAGGGATGAGGRTER